MLKLLFTRMFTKKAMTQIFYNIDKNSELNFESGIVFDSNLDSESTSGPEIKLNPEIDLKSDTELKLERNSEIEKFDAIASHWWDTSGPFKPLHLMNPARLTFMRESLRLHQTRTFEGLSLLDVGCGGGLLCEPLARMGAKVTGIDASPAAIHVAKEHAEQENLSIHYCESTVEHYHEANFDIVCALEIVEHVDDPGAFIEACVHRLKPGGSLYISTMTRDITSYMKAIILAEYVLKWVPKGTHEWKKFIKPSEMALYLRKAGADICEYKGFMYHPLKQTWSLTNDTQTNYIIMACKK